MRAMDFAHGEQTISDLVAVDLFAGLGGTTTGAEAAGVKVVWVGNHWELAVDYHRRNHPHAIHVCQDLQQFNFARLPWHNLLLASPCCQGHSWARGKAHGNPEHDASRATAWAVISALEAGRADYAVIENVPEFLEWALFPAWEDALRRLGYTGSPHIIDVADLGVPQHRVRMFYVITKSKSPIHLNLEKEPWLGADSFIDFDSGNWSQVDKPGRAPATLQRVARGRAAFGDRFIMPYYKSGSGLTGRDITRPIGTITTKARWAVVDGDRMRMLTVPENVSAMTFPRDVILPSSAQAAIHMLGNAVPPRAVTKVLTALRKAA